MTATEDNEKARSRPSAGVDDAVVLPLRIGITGGMGSGKSVVTTLLGARLAGVVISADHVCRRLLHPGAAGWRRVRQEFGDEYFTSDDVLDRQKLRQAVFSDQGIRARLNDQLHPLALEAIRQDMQAGVQQGKIVLVEVPLLYEVNWQGCFDRIVLVYARRQQCLQRMIRRDHCSRQAAEAALASQLPLVDKVWWAHHVVDNSSTLVETHLQLVHLADLLLSGRKT